MFTLLAILFLLFLITEYWPILLVCLILIVLMVVFFCMRKKQVRVVEVDPSEKAQYKVGAEVGYQLYEEIKRYCRKHNMSISDLIRKSVREYMDANK